MALYSVRYWCKLHDDPKSYVVEIPWPDESHPTPEQVWCVIKKDPALLQKLFGDDFADYADMALRCEHYEDLLERTSQTCALVIDYYDPEPTKTQHQKASHPVAKSAPKDRRCFFPQGRTL